VSTIFCIARHAGSTAPTIDFCTAFRLRHLEGSETAVDALRRWLARSDSKPVTLLAMEVVVQADRDVLGHARHNAKVW
jgi:hypothetical protein